MRKLNFLIWVLALCCLTINVDAQCPNNYTIEVHKHPTCSNSDNGTLRADYTTYYAGTTYQWSNGSTNRYAYNLAPGNYSVTATDPSTCTYTNSFYLSASPTGMTANLYSNTCNNAYVAVSSNGQWPYTYQWSSGDVTSSITNPVPGVYSLVLTDADGCVATGSHTILPYSVPTITYTTQNATCGNSDGTVDLTVTGGDGPFTYYWYTGQQTTQDVSNLPVGQHTVRITDNKGCNRYESIIIDGPKVTLAGTNLSCGLTNGSMTATVHNASNPTYLWSNGATSATINNLAAGSYSVTASIGGCQLTSSRYIWDGGSLNYISLTDSLQGSGGCAPDSLMATTWDGSGSYFYLWSTGETSQTIHNIVPGATYSVTLTDAIGGCTGDTSITIGSANLNLTATVTDATCSNSDGAADLTVSGGFGSYTYLWSPGGYTTEDISNVPAGSYTVDVQETGTNCISQLTVLVGAQSVTVNTVDATCGLNNGSISLTPNGFVSPTYAWSTGANTATINNLAAGTYVATISDGSCSLVETIQLNGLASPTVSIDAPSTCNPSYLTAAITGDLSLYSFLWSDGSTTQVLLNPTFGVSYSVTATLSGGCSANDTYLVPNPPAINASYVVQDATCGNKNGQIDLTVTGGTAPFNYAWSVGNGNTEDLYPVYPGSYSVRIEDNAGCELNLSGIIVGGQNNIILSRSVTKVNCAGAGGAIDLTVAGATNPTFQWSNGSTTEDISGLTQGTYSVVVTDAGGTGCSRTLYVYVGKDNNCSSTICGRVYDISQTANCSPAGAIRVAYQMIRLQPSGQITFTNASGYYRFTVAAAGNYSVELVNNDPNTTVVCPNPNTIAVNSVILGNSYCSNDFFISNPPTQDLSVNLYHTTNATPGFPYRTYIRYCNDGNIDMNGTLEYDYNGALGFNSISGWNSTLTLHDIPNHKFYWSFSNLAAGSCRRVAVDFAVPTTMALGTPLIGDATVLPLTGDATPANNNDTDNTYVVGSWDPNEKRTSTFRTGDELSGGTIYQTDEVLDYTIHFQNTGTAPAYTVVVRDTLDANLLPSTIQEIITSHDCEVTMEGTNVLVFTFDNINLPDSGTQFMESNGHIKFKINRQAGLSVGTQIENKAAIYFDFNAPIITNTVVSIIDANTAVEEVDATKLNVAVMPNPFHEQFKLQYTLDKDTEVNITLYNALGEQVKVYDVNTAKAVGVHLHQLSTEALPSGMYFLQIATEAQHKTVRIIKQ